jgi:hypothetical protein
VTDKPDQFKFLKRHLQTQIRAADRIGSKWVYILKEEAEKCLQLAEAEDTIFADPVEPELDGGGSSWFYLCSECRTVLSSQRDKFCRECGRRIKW